MAVAVDSFDLLLQEIGNLYREYTTFDLKSLTFRDYLTIFGGLCAIGSAYWLTKRVYGGLKVHFISRLFSRADLHQRYGPWAVVTGCTGGIGEAFVYECASSGLNLVLISRSQHSLDQLAHKIESTFNVQTCIVAVDFNEGPPVYEKIKDALADKEIGILVNNVGVMYDYPQMFLDVPESKIWQLVNVNVAAATMMTSIVLPRMIERKRGAVVTMSSSSALLPTPQMTVYSATKVYLDAFMKALSYEYKDSGVMFQTLTPFYVATRMTEYSSTLSNTSLLIPSATDYARSAMNTLGWSQRTTGYWPHSIQAFFGGLIPENLWMWGAMRLNDALRRQAFSRLKRRESKKKSS